MKKEIAERWVKALTSGKYQQGKGQLKSNDGKSFCCLGVLCDLAAEDQIGTWVKKPSLSCKCEDCAERTTYLFTNGMAWDEAQEDYPPLSDSHVLPPAVIEWAGLQSNNGAFTHLACFTLTNLNDQEDRDFDHIADIILIGYEKL